MRPFRLAAASFLSVLVACGDAAPRVPARSAAEWAADLESPSVEKAGAASKALAELAATGGPAVTDALVAALSRTTPPADATAFSVRLDEAQARRLALAPLDAPDAVALVLPFVRRRVVDRGLTLGTLRGDGAGVIDVILIGATPPAEAARLAREVCRRGALELRAVFVPPRIDATAAAAFATWRDAEIEAFTKAEREGAPYLPSRKDLRVARDASVPAPTFAVLVEPAGPADAFDERVATATTAFVGTDGRGRVRLAVDPARRADLTRWTTSLVGREIAVVRDDVVQERTRVNVPWSATIDVLAAGEPSSPPDETARARADASALALGRLPRPLAPVPAAQARPLSDLLAPSLERSVLAVGAAAIPALERLATAELPASRKALVTRALTALRARAERQEEAIRAQKAQEAEEKRREAEGSPDPRDTAIEGGGNAPPPK